MIEVTPFLTYAYGLCDLYMERRPVKISLHKSRCMAQKDMKRSYEDDFGTNVVLWSLITGRVTCGCGLDFLLIKIAQSKII